MHVFSAPKQVPCSYTCTKILRRKTTPPKHHSKLRTVNSSKPQRVKIMELGLPGPPKEPKIMDQCPRIESIGSIESIVLENFGGFGEQPFVVWLWSLIP